jgi:hypothetical protein
MAILVAALLFPSAVGDQLQEAKQRAENLLSSASVLDRAWGAYEAGRLHENSLDKLLTDRLGEAVIYVDSASASEERAYVFVLFDALIESGVKVPADVLLPIKERWRDET